MMQASICEDIGINAQHFREISATSGRYELICDDSNQIIWLRTLLRRQKIAVFPNSKHLDKQANVLQHTGLEHPWAHLFVQIYSKQPQLKVFPLPQADGADELSNNNGIPSTYSQAVAYVTCTNFKNLWEAAYKRYKKSHVKFCKQGTGNHAANHEHRNCNLLHYDIVLKELLQRIFQCPILHCKLDRLRGEETPESDIQPNLEPKSINNENSSNILPACIAIETSSHYCVFFYPPFISTTLYDCITFSPAVLGKSYNKTLFLIYQICQTSKKLQSDGLFLGDVRLHDIFMRDNLWLQIVPHIDTNMLIQPHVQFVNTPSDIVERTPSLEQPTNECLNTTNCEDVCDPANTKFDLKFAYDVDHFSLREYCEMWCNGQLSNFDYLTILNNAAGRSLKDPAHYHIMPWVTDFSVRNGANWRDLTKSKYRLNKGDAHLDLMYAGTPHASGGCAGSSHSGEDIDSAQFPHHVSDFLSEITYFVYMSRRTPQKILCEHVRPIWVPAEYPASIQRLQAWTPDECIPEFYSDPLIFKSIHEDLPDLELPTWSSCPEDFICKHREALESQYVSERLQHWIDLNFGYKLTGKAAIKSKNVCLSMVDQHRNLTQRGIVQLFAQPHPPKRFPLLWFTSSAPRLSQLYNNSFASPNPKSASVRSRSGQHNLTEISKRLAKSTENLHTVSTTTAAGSASSSPRSRTERSQSRSNNAAKTLPKDERETMTSTSTANFYATTNFIELPKDYNPSALIQSLETQQNFFARTFPMQKAATNALEKIITNDLMFEENSEEHSYTNQLFANDEVNGGAASAVADEALHKNKPKNLLAPCINSIKKQTFENLLHERRARELQVIGCLIVELFLLHRLRPLLINGASASFEDRLNACRIVANQYRLELPKCVRYTVMLLLLSYTEKSQIVNDKGLALPTAAQLLEPIFSNALLPFPNNYYPTYTLIRSLHAFEIDAALLELQTHFNCNGKECGRYAEIDRARVLFSRKIAECKVMSCCAHIGRLLDPIAFEQFASIELLLPHFIELLNDEQTSILAAWNLFDSVAQALGIKQTQKYFLLPLMKLYDVESFERGMHSLRARSSVDRAMAASGQVRFSINSSFKSRKSVKLYHHSFLLHLIVRFGLRCFLQNFITPLIEAVGGFKEPEEGTGFHYHSGNPDDARRTSKILSYLSDEQNLESITTTTTTTTIMQESGDATLSSNDTVGPSKEEIEEVFTFEDDANSDFVSNSGTGENKSIDSFDMRPATAEEAKEETTPEKLSINEIIYGGNISNTSFDDSNADSNSEDKISLRSHNASSGAGGTNEGLENRGPKSPTIAIPTLNIFHRNYQLNAIDCEIGSRKSIDSFEILTQAAAEEEAQKARSRSGTLTANANQEMLPTQQQTEEESQDSLQASVISKMSEAKQAQNNRIAEMSAESLVWLSHRLGPVLTSRFVTRNLLKMLSLCYVGQENLLPELAENGETLSPTDFSRNLNYFSIADARVIGDRSAARVLECLVSIAALFGEQIILLQYFPHISEVVAMGTKRLTSSLEGAIISSLQLLKYLVPCLTDATLMDRMNEIIVESILSPILRLLASTRLSMPNGYLGRSVLARKLLDAVYALSVRIGSDMSKEQLCIPVLRPFFLIFDKVYGNMEHFDEKSQFSNSISITPPDATTNSRENEELRDVFSPALAHISYLSFLRFLGESIMRRTLLNFEFILTLCHDFELPDYQQSSTYASGQHRGSDAVDCPTPKNGSEQTQVQDEVSAANSFGTQLIGNRIQVVNNSQTQIRAPTQAQQQLQQSKQVANIGPMEVLDMVAFKFEHVSNTRHLKGNWLAYWRHEITRADNDAKLNLKQIKLQSFVGHANSVRSIIALDNENSFISASKDKTVKLWSLRSEGDGTKATSCQFTYTAHKKSITSLAYLEAMRFVVSCDAGVHIWDPFIGRPLGMLDSQRHNPVTVVKCLPSPSPLIVAGTAEASVRIIDSRSMQYVTDWRVASALQSNATVRCLTVAPSGNWLAAGLSTGGIVLLDTRTGLVLNAWRPMECDLLQLAAPNDQQLISSSLDHSLAVWHANDGILHYQLRPPAEPAHYLQTNGSELIFATTGNRIGLYTDLSSSHAAYSVTKLRSETFRGVLTSLAVLPLNRAFLAGNESGNIVLLC